MRPACGTGNDVHLESTWWFAVSVGRSLDGSRVNSGNEYDFGAGIRVRTQAARGSLGTVHEPMRLSFRPSHGSQTRTMPKQYFTVYFIALINSCRAIFFQNIIMEKDDWKEHRTNISILEEIGLERELMGKLSRMKLQYFGHVTRGSAGNLALTVLEGSIDGLRHQGRPKRQWMDDIEEWSDCSYIQLKEMSQDKEQWRRKTIEWSSAVANRH